MLSSPATVQMVRCPVCDATGKTGTTLGFGGTVCALCHGTCFLRSEPNPCPCCNANVSDTGYVCYAGQKNHLLQYCRLVQLMCCLSSVPTSI